MTKRLDPSTKLQQKKEERVCECGAAGSGEGHAGWCKAEKFNRIPRTMSATKALRWIQTHENRYSEY